MLLTLHRAVQSLSIKEFATTEVLIIIGQGSTQGRWVLDEKMLCDRYAYFRAAFQGGWSETYTKTITLPEDDPKEFGFIVDLILYGKTNIYRHFGRDDQALQLGLCKAYLLVDMFGCEDLAVTIHNVFLCYICSSPAGFATRRVSNEAAKLIIDNTMDSDRLQRVRRNFLGLSVPLFPLPS